MLNYMDWDAILDGQPHLLRQIAADHRRTSDLDFRVSPQQLAAKARAEAKKRGLKVMTRSSGTTTLVQAYRTNPPRPTFRDAIKTPQPQDTAGATCLPPPNRDTTYQQGTAQP